MKRIFLYGLFCAAATLTACDDLWKDLDTPDEAEPTVSMGLFEPNKGEALDTEKLYADGQSIAIVKVLVTPSILLPEDRKIKLSTTVGDFIIDGTPKKAVDAILDGNSEVEVVLRSPKSAGPGFILFSSEMNIEPKKLFVSFKKALPDTIFIETSNYSLRDTSENIVTARMLRTNGIPSSNQLLLFELRTSDNEKAQNSSFVNTTLSDTAGVSKSNLHLKGQEKGTYKIIVRLAESARIYGSHEIKVID